MNRNPRRVTWYQNSQSYVYNTKWQLAISCRHSTASEVATLHCHGWCHWRWWNTTEMSHTNNIM